MFFFTTLFLFFCLALGYFYGRQGVHRWILQDMFSSAKHQNNSEKQHVILAFVDHFEPGYFNPGIEKERARVDRWVKRYPEMASLYKDSDGLHPQHTFFYPDEEYKQEHLDKIAGICRAGFGEIEVHLHHDHDTEQGLRTRINNFTEILRNDHDALSICPQTGKPVFAFIHGNWCLDNSGVDGTGCGVNNELIVLKDLGCYADFTFPSAPSPTQTSKINSIYYATDDAAKPKSHDSGEDVKVGGKETGHLMIIQGALGINFKWRKWGLLPKLDNSDIRSVSKTIRERIDFWIAKNIHVQGRSEWKFVKLHTHGTQEWDEEAMFGPSMHGMYQHLQNHYCEKLGWDIHYVSAREMYNIIKAAEAGKSGNPNDYRNFIFPKPSFKERSSQESVI